MNELTIDGALEVIKHHKDYFHTNETKEVSFRIKQLKRLKWAMKFYEKEVLDALKTDLGKHPTESYMTEVGYVYKSIDEMVKQIEKWAKPVSIKTPFYMMPAKSYMTYDPYGTVLIIGPFNYPYQLVMEPLVGAIAAGNCAVVKPSELSPAVAKVITKIIKKAFRPCYIECINGSIPTNTALLSVEFDYIFFTGSPAIGKVVMEAASKHLTPVTLELGGKSPVIVDKNANLKSAARRIVWGKMINAGQTCVAPDYIYVHKDVKDELIHQLILAFRRGYGKDAYKSKSFGRIINDRHTKRLLTILEKEKANIVYGGHYEEAAHYIGPTIINASGWDAPSMQEELFGPILPIMTYENLDNVIGEINLYHKPLALYVFSENKAIQKKVIHETSSGGVCINDVLSHVANPNLPFGGVGNSGIGAYHAKESFFTFSHRKSVFQNLGSLSSLLSEPPYNKLQDKMIRMFFK
ncbi:MAG: aldehyde dehydrogenase [bacterium]|nr:aldehyde dehydrogenase [bacterium]